MEYGDFHSDKKKKKIVVISLNNCFFPCTALMSVLQILAMKIS